MLRIVVAYTLFAILLAAVGVTIALFIRHRRRERERIWGRRRNRNLD
ncbi:hypothetical protein [Sphingomonas sp. 67-36]|nr:hypothetical protein [Sphingomonas sp. 67-36]